MGLTQLLFDTLVLGCAYALVALGFVLVLNATGAVNFAHGDLVMVGGFAAVALGGWLSWPGLVLLPLVVVLMALLGAAVALAAYFPLRRRPPEAVFISTIAVGIILRNAALLIFGPEPRLAPSLVGTGTLRFAGAAVSRQGLGIVVVATLLIGALHILFSHTQVGRRMRAAAQDRDMAAAIGIRVDPMIAAAFAIGAALAGTAGLLLGATYFVAPADGANAMFKAYVAVVIGGWGSIPGAVAGAMLIACFEVLYPGLPLLFPGLDRLPAAAAIFSQPASESLLDGIALLLLIARPRGLFGEAAGERS